MCLQFLYLIFYGFFSGLSIAELDKSRVVDKLKTLAKRRKLEDLTVGPVLTASLFKHSAAFLNSSNF